MTMNEVRERARRAGVSTDGRKADIIHRIQKAEGYAPCFATRERCSQMTCCWREDCLPAQFVNMA